MINSIKKRSRVRSPASPEKKPLKTQGSAFFNGLNRPRKLLFCGLFLLRLCLELFFGRKGGYIIGPARTGLEWTVLLHATKNRPYILSLPYWPKVQPLLKWSLVGEKIGLNCCNEFVEVATQSCQRDSRKG